MNAYAFAASPFGNFAVSLGSEPEQYRFTPIGRLTEVPLVENATLGPILDRDALAAEAHRQLAARHVQAAPFRIPSPEFTINRVPYSSEFEIITAHYYDGREVMACRSMYHNLSDSAERKLIAWWQQARDEIVTPAFLAETEHRRAEHALRYAADALRDAEALASRAREDHAEAVARRDAALAAMTSAHLDEVSA